MFVIFSNSEIFYLTGQYIVRIGKYHLRKILKLILRDLLYKSPYLVRMRENTDQKNSEYGYFLRR